MAKEWQEHSPLGKFRFFTPEKRRKYSWYQIWTTGIYILVNGKVFDNTMPPMGLEDEEIADVMNYTLNSWGNKSDSIVTPEEVTMNIIE